MMRILELYKIALYEYAFKHKSSSGLHLCFIFAIMLYNMESNVLGFSYWFGKVFNMGLCFMLLYAFQVVRDKSTKEGKLNLWTQKYRFWANDYNYPLIWLILVVSKFQIIVFHLKELSLFINPILCVWTCDTKGSSLPSSL